MNITLDMEYFAADFADQLQQQGVEIGDFPVIWYQNYRNYIMILSIEGLVTEKENERILERLKKLMLKKLQQCQKKAAQDTVQDVIV